MGFISSKALRGIDRASEIAGQALPFFVGAPVGGAHFLFEQPADKLGNRSVFVGGFATRPKGNLGIEADCEVLQHGISLAGGPRKGRPGSLAFAAITRRAWFLRRVLRSSRPRRC